MKKPKTSYEKDVLFLSKFLAGRTNGLHLDTADLVRAERLFMQLTSPTKKNPEGRALYITFNGKGVFRRQYGQDDSLVIRGINTNFLDKIIEKLDPPELSKQEIEAVDAFLLAKDSHDAAVASGSDEPPPPPTPAEAYPEPVEILVGEPPEAAFTPVDVPFDDLRMAKAQFLKEYHEFLIRFRYLVQGSDPTKDPQINHKFLTPAGVLDVDRFPEVAKWFAILPVIGSQFGVVDSKLPAPASNKPLDQCLEMMMYSPKKASNILILEGFKEDFNTDKGEIYVDSIREFEYALKQLENSTNQLVLLAPGIEWGSSAVPKLMTAYSLNGPDYADIEQIVREILATVYRTSPELYFNVIKNVTKQAEPDAAAFDGAMTKIINSLRGLSEFQISDVIWTSVRSWQDLDPETLDGARKDIINRTPGLTIYEPDVDFNDIGGMENLRNWIQEKGDKLFLSAEQAKEEGSNVYKGILLVGLPGTGKSLVTKAIAKYLSENTSGYSVSLIQLDVGALMGQYVGMTEQRTREALRTVETFAPTILWIDEIEKAFSGSGGSGHEVSRRMLGTFLTFMQERKSPVFIIGTANNIDALPPEFKRKGRWDAIFFMPLPDKDAVVNILDYHLSKFKIAKGKMNSIKKVIANTEDGQKKFLIWRRLASTGNLKGEAERVLGPGGKILTEPDPETGVLREVYRNLGLTGAEIESGVQAAASRAQARYNNLKKKNQNLPSSWKDLLTVDDLIVSLQAFKPISRQDSEGGPDKPSVPMSYIMYRLEQVADKVLSLQEIEKQKEKLKQELGQIEVNETEVEEVNKLLGDIEGLTNKRKNPQKNSEFSTFYLLGNEFYRRWYS